MSVELLRVFGSRGVQHKSGWKAARGMMLDGLD
jgi:hypothetical protein